MSEVEIVIDGSCLGNPGPGGWACILRYGEHERVLQGGVADTTNNRMELIAAIEGLRALKRTSEVTVLTDSEYVRRGITEFLPRWKANDWCNSAGKPVANRDLWEELEELAGYHEVTWIHVRGHSGQPNHERCDSLAVTAARAAKRDAAQAKVNSAVFSAGIVATARLRPDASPGPNLQDARSSTS
jgi:ribonuclease HI